MQALAQEAVSWPGIDANITNYVKRCAICTQHKGSPLFSKHPFLFHMTSKTAQSLIQKFQNIMSQDDFPSILYSDNGPPFTAEEFEPFLQRQYINHITSSPHFHQSNGFIEQQVKILKTTLSTSKLPEHPLRKNK